MKQSVYIGFDPREVDAFAVAHESVSRNTIAAMTRVRGVVLEEQRRAGLYHRPTSRRRKVGDIWLPSNCRDAQLWDDISDAPMSTEFAISRFLTPILAREGLALFMDADMLVRAPLGPLFGMARADPSKAVWCVKHCHEPPEGVKMDGQAQTRYARKNWSSVMLFNVQHPANARLTVEMINEVPGRDLHRFCWLRDDEIGELSADWNYLVGHTALPAGMAPRIVHFTDGVPSMAGYEGCEYADEWTATLRRWAA